MPDKHISNFLAFLYVLAAISGAAGGCLVAAHHVLRGRNVTALFVMAYGFVGLIFGLSGVIVITTFTSAELTVQSGFLIGLILGAVGSSSLAGANLSARVIMRRLGIEVDVEIRRVDKGDDTK